MLLYLRDKSHILIIAFQLQKTTIIKHKKSIYLPSIVRFSNIAMSTIPIYVNHLKNLITTYFKFFNTIIFRIF